MDTSAFQDDKQVFNSTMKNVDLPVVSERHTSWMFNILHKLLQHHKNTKNYKLSYALLTRAVEDSKELRKWAELVLQFCFFPPGLSPVVSKGSSLAGTTPSKSVTTHLHIACRLCDARDTAPERQLRF